VFSTPPPDESGRLPEDARARLWASLRSAGLAMRVEPVAANALAELRGLYEPFVKALAAHFLFPLPAFQPDKPPVDNWQSSPWMPRSPGLGGLPGGDGQDDHFG
jgi:hypothetical protein